MYPEDRKYLNILEVNEDGERRAQDERQGFLYALRTMQRRSKVLSIIGYYYYVVFLIKGDISRAGVTCDQLLLDSHFYLIYLVIEHPLLHVLTDWKADHCVDRSAQHRLLKPFKSYCGVSVAIESALTKLTS